MDQKEIMRLSKQKPQTNNIVNVLNLYGAEIDEKIKEEQKRMEEKIKHQRRPDDNIKTCNDFDAFIKETDIENKKPIDFNILAKDVPENLRKYKGNIKGLEEHTKKIAIEVSTQ